MIPFAGLTRLGRLRRMRQLAQAALTEYGLGAVRFKFYLQAGNTLYRVYDESQQSNQDDHDDHDLFEPGQYLLRIYQPGWQTIEAIELELSWLAAMRQEAGLPVPEPIPSLGGRFMTQVAVPGIPEERVCSLMRWVKGRLLHHDGRPEHYRAQGRLMAQIHDFTQQWQLPPNLSKRHYDWEGLFMNDPEIGLEPGQSWAYLPPDWNKPFQWVASQFRQLVESWGIGPEVYGLIHADMGLDANVLFYRGQPRPIDFDGSGFGYWLYDLAVALAHVIGTASYGSFRDALFEGYLKHRVLPDWQLSQLDLLTAAFYVYYDLWVVGVTHNHPEYLNVDMEELMYRGATFILDFVNNSL